MEETQIGVNPVPPIADERFVWLITRPDPGPGELSRLDTQSGELRRIDADSLPERMTFGDGHLWVGHRRSVWRIDPTSGEADAKIPTDSAVRGLAYGGGYVWAATTDDLHRIDPESAQIDRLTPIRSGPVDGQIWAVVHLGDSVWVLLG